MLQTDSPSVPPAIAIPPAFRTHIVKAMLSAIPAGWLFFLIYEMTFVQEAPSDAAFQYKLEAGFFIVAVLLAWVTVRNVRALFVRPEFILTPDGFRLTSWRGVGFLELLLPYYRMRQHVVPWGDFVESLNYSHKVNGVTMVQELRLTTKTQGLIAFGWDVFRPGIAKIQRTMLDYLDERFRASKRAEGRIPEFQRRRWVEPLVFRGDNLHGWLVVACWVLTGGLVFAVNLRGFVDDWVMIAAFVCGIVSFVLTQRWRNATSCRHVVLGADGLSVGPDAAKCRTIPWEDIRFVRAHTQADVRNNQAGEIERLEVRLGNGQVVLIQGWNQKDFQRLIAHLEPPLDRLADVWSQLAQGKSPEAAAAAAGLLSRS